MPPQMLITRFTRICNRRTVLVACSSILLASCVAKRSKYDVPEIPLPDKFSKPPVVSISDSTDSVAPVLVEDDSGLKGTSAVPVKSEVQMRDVLPNWWHLLGSAELDGLMDRALANNQDLRIAAYRIVEAKARSDQASAGRFPSVSIPIAVRNVAPYYGIGSVQPGQKVDHKVTYEASIRGDMRADIWGERQSLYQSADLQLWSTTFQRDDVQRMLVASVVSGYVDYLSLNDRIRVARETEGVLSGMENSAVERMKGGDATIIDVEQMRAEVNAVRATIPVLELLREQVVDSIALLAGSVPGMLALSDKGLDSLSFPSVLPGVPSSLLLRRPDVRAAEAQLISADANIDVARSEVLPALDLTLEVGTGASVLSHLFNPNTIFWNAIANLSANIFDAGKRSNEVVYARAVHEEMVENYVRVIYRAVRDVEDSLVYIRKMGDRLKAQQASVEAAHRAWDFSSESYGAGAVDYLVMLDTERTYHSKLDEVHSVRKDRYHGLVNLFLALGGGVQQGETIPGKGLRPVIPADGIGASELATATDSWDMEGIDYDENEQNRNGAEVWLVELPAIYESTLIVPAWRDLLGRFPQVITDHRLWPRLQGRVEGRNSDMDRAAWYRLFIAQFSSSKEADDLCNKLTGMRCRAISSKSSDFLDGDAVAPRSKQKHKPVLKKLTPIQSTISVEPSANKVAAPIQPAGRKVSESQPETVPTADSVLYTFTEAEAEAESSSATLATAIPIYRESSTTTEANYEYPDKPKATVEHVSRPGYAVQLGTYTTLAKASKVASDWEAKGYLLPYVYKTKEGRFTVRVGRFSERAEASNLAKSIRQNAGIQAIPVPAMFDGDSFRIEDSSAGSALRGRN